MTFLPSFLPLGATAQGELWHPEQSASILLCFLSLSFCGDHHVHHPTISNWVFLVHQSEADYLVSEQIVFLRREVVSITPNPQPGGPGYPSSSGSYPFTFPAWVPLPVATLPPA
jgi:hypothetical protein